MDIVKQANRYVGRADPSAACDHIIDLLAEVERLRAAFLRHLMRENYCYPGEPCKDPAKCGCRLEMQMNIDAIADEQKADGK